MPVLDPTYLVLAVLVGTLVLFVTDLLRYDLVALLAVVVLVLGGALQARTAFLGFSSEAVVLIAAMYVFGSAMGRSGVAEAIGKRFLRARRGSEAALVTRVCLAAGLLSSVLSNTGVVAAFIPVCVSVARKRRVSASRLLMPLAFGSLLGGLVTVIATSGNIVVNEAIRDSGGEPFGMFEFSHLGLVLLVAGSLYLVGPGRRLLPRSPVDQTLAERYQVPKFVSEILVEPTSTLINRAVADVELFTRHRVSVLGIVRQGGESPVLAPGPYNRIRADDTLILQGTPEDLLALSEELPMQRREYVETAETRLYSDDVRLVEAIVPAGSSLAGTSLAQAEFRTSTGLNVMAVSKAGELQLDRIQDLELGIGDTLLVQGHVRDIERARQGREVLVLDEIGAPRLGRRGWVSIALLATVLLCAALFPTLSLAVLGLAGALGLVLTGVLRVDEAYRAVDWSVVVLVGGMLTLGHAFQVRVLTPDNTARIQEWITTGLESGSLSPTLLLVGLLSATVLLTQVLNNASTAAIMTPIAVELAAATGIESRPLLMAVITGSSLAFLSPVAHQANAMVMGPGGYRYRDYLRMGAPLTLGLMVLASLLIPIFWPL